DSPLVPDELEKAGGDTRVVGLVGFAGTEHVEEAEADRGGLETVQIRLHPAVEDKLRLAVRIEGPLTHGVAHPTQPGSAVEGGGRGVDHRHATKLTELDPLACVLEVVAQHLRHVGLEDVRPGAHVEDNVERGDTPVEILQAQAVDGEVIEEVGEVKARGVGQLLGAACVGIYQQNPVTSPVIERAHQARADETGSSCHQAPSGIHRAKNPRIWSATYSIVATGISG